MRGRIETEGTGAPAVRPRASTAVAARPSSLGSAASTSASHTNVARRPELSRPVATAKPAPAPAPVKREPPPPPRVIAAPPPPPPAREVAPVREDEEDDAAETRGKKQPPPPVVTAPRKGAKGRKKAAKREG